MSNGRHMQPFLDRRVDTLEQCVCTLQKSALAHDEQIAKMLELIEALTDKLQEITPTPTSTAREG